MKKLMKFFGTLLFLSIMAPGCGETNTENLRLEGDKIEETNEMDLSRRAHRRRAKIRRANKKAKAKQSTARPGTRCRFNCDTNTTQQPVDPQPQPETVAEQTVIEAPQLNVGSGYNLVPISGFRTDNTPLTWDKCLHVEADTGIVSERSNSERNRSECVDDGLSNYLRLTFAPGYNNGYQFDTLANKSIFYFQQIGDKKVLTASDDRTIPESSRIRLKPSAADNGHYKIRIYGEGIESNTCLGKTGDAYGYAFKISCDQETTEFVKVYWSFAGLPDSYTPVIANSSKERSANLIQRIGVDVGEVKVWFPYAHKMLLAKMEELTTDVHKGYLTGTSSYPFNSVVENLVGLPEALYSDYRGELELTCSSDSHCYLKSWFAAGGTNAERLYLEVDGSGAPLAEPTVRFKRMTRAEAYNNDLVKFKLYKESASSLVQLKHLDSGYCFGVKRNGSEGFDWNRCSHSNESAAVVIIDENGKELK